MSKKDICSYSFEELKEEIARIGEKAFRSTQIYEWLHVKLAENFDEMTNLSKALREKLPLENDGCVTVRDRDTMEQERIRIEELENYLNKKTEF